MDEHISSRLNDSNERREQGDFKADLQKILSTSLSPENIHTYADDALDQLIELIQRAVEDYAYQPTIDHDTRLAQEIAAFSYHRMDNIEHILDHIQDKARELSDLDQLISKAHRSSRVITPPISTEFTLREGDGSYQKKRTIPRLKTLLFLASNAMSVNLKNPEEFKLTEGAVDSEIMRELPYFLVEMPQINRTVLVCDEEGNATFVFNDTAMKDLGISPEDLLPLTKLDLEDIISQCPEVGVWLKYDSTTYVERLSRLLADEWIQNETEETATETTGNYLHPKAPEGYMIKSELANVLNVSESSVRRAVKVLMIEPEVYRSKKGQLLRYYSPEHAERIRAFLEEQGLYLDEPPEGFENLEMLVMRWPDIGSTSIRAVIIDTTLEGKEYRHKGRIPSKFYSPTEIIILENGLEARGLLTPKPPEGYKGVTEIARTFSLSNTSTVNRAIKELGLKGVDYRSPNGVIPHYSPEDIERMRVYLESEGLFAKDAPEGYLTAPGISDKFGISRKTLKVAIDFLGIKGEMLRGKSKRPELHFRPVDIDRLEVYFEENGLLNPSLPPDGYLHKEALWRTLEMSETLVKKAINELGIKGEKYYSETLRRLVVYYPPQTIKSIQDWALERQEGYAVVPDDSWKSVNAIANELDLDVTTISRVIRQIELEGVLYARVRGTKPVAFYSKDSQDKIFNYLEQQGYFTDFAPEDFKTITNLEDQWGMRHDDVAAAIESLGVESVIYRSAKSKRPERFYSPDKIERIKAEAERLIQERVAKIGRSTVRSVVRSP